MAQDSFEQECDRISQGVDSVQFERQRWAKTEGPMLAKMVELAHATFADRDDFELSEEGASSDIKRFVLKAHSFRVIGVVIWLDQGHALINAEDISRSKYALTPGDPVTAEFCHVDAAWMADALHRLLARIRF